MESYIPLLDSLYELKNEGISPHITLSLTPVLCEQLSHPGFGPALVNYIQEKIDFARHNSEEFQRHGNSHKAWLADWWLDFYTRAGESFTNTYRKDLIAAFKTLQDEGHIEIITSAATHGYLPLLGYDECVRAQIQTGVQSLPPALWKAPQGHLAS